MLNPEDDVAFQLMPEKPDALDVLVVDDDALVRQKLAAMLEPAGYTVRLAASGEEALRELDRKACPIVLSDWEMPQMDGLALCRNIRQRQRDSYTYILLLTIRQSKRDIVAGLNAGADDYIVKSASSEELLARLNTGRRIVTLERSLTAAYHENRRLTVTDPLTGARNRRFLLKYLPREYERCRRYAHPIAVLMFDLDHFKAINHGFGQDAGDEVLKAVVERVSEQLRASDWIARSGGEEFAIVLPETDLAGARTLAERIRNTIRANPIRTGAGPLTVTASFGCSAINLPRELLRFSAEDLLRTAEQCMRRSKESGRDRITGELAQRTEEAPTKNTVDVPSQLRIVEYADAG